jgi:lysophospholipase L1-like esterase
MAADFSAPSGGPVSLPIRVLVKGASTVNWTSFMGGPRSDFAYPRATEACLLAGGRPAEVRDTSVAAEHPKQALRDWQREVVNWSPDVVVLHYGHMETIHLFLPRALQRHAQSIRNRPGPIRDAYRQRLLRPAWKTLARLQQRVYRKVAARALFAHRFRRAGLDLEQLIKRIQDVGSPLVLVMELTPPGANYADWFPGMGQRLEQMNDVLRDVVRRVDRPNVRIFHTRAALADVAASPDELNPDGAHYSPAAHRALGAALAREIAEWTDREGHLRVG